MSGFQKTLESLKMKIKDPEVNMTEENIQKNLLKSQLITERNKVIINTMSAKQQYLKNIFQYGLYYDKKLTDMVCSVYYSNFKSDHLPMMNKRREEIFKNNEEDIRGLTNKTDWGVNDCKLILFKIFMKLIKSQSSIPVISPFEY